MQNWDQEGEALGKVEVYVRTNVTHKGHAGEGSLSGLESLGNIFYRHLMESCEALELIRRIVTSYPRLLRVVLFVWSHMQESLPWSLYPKVRPNSKQVNRRRVGQLSPASREW